jgi:hypothetical protein
MPFGSRRNGPKVTVDIARVQRTLLTNLNHGMVNGSLRQFYDQALSLTRSEEGIRALLTGLAGRKFKPLAWSMQLRDMHDPAKENWSVANVFESLAQEIIANLPDTYVETPASEACAYMASVFGVTVDEPGLIEEVGVELQVCGYELITSLSRNDRVVTLGDHDYFHGRCKRVISDCVLSHLKEDDGKALAHLRKQGAYTTYQLNVITQTALWCYENDVEPAAAKAKLDAALRTRSQDQ